MKRVLLAVIFLFQLTCVYSQSKPVKFERKFKLPQGITSKDYLPNRIIVKFKDSTAQTIQPRSKASAPSVSLRGVKVQSLRNKFSSKNATIKPARIARQKDVGLSRIYEMQFSGSQNIEAVINEILLDENVEYAEPVYIYRKNYTPNDPDYLNNSQSYLDQIKASLAWNIVRDASNVVIAIVDSGSDLTHPDLSSNIYINSADPVNGIDDDSDGFVDNYRGWDFVGFSGIQPEEDNNPNVTSDSTDHGVHVSGIASAVSDNGIGVSSVANNAKLMIIKTGADNDASNIYAGPEGIKYAADHGAHIINCSWGSPGISAYVQDIVNYAISRGCLVVAAAGNSNSTQADYPAGYSGVLAVASVRSNDFKSGSSNYGSYVSISAPGTSIRNTGFNGSYKVYSGTSMAAPLVSSAAALLKARFPEMTMQEVGQRLRATADNIESINPDFAGKLGAGRLNIYRALTEAPPSIRNQKLNIVDKGNGTYPAGDTLELYFDLKNFLSPASNLVVSLSTSNPHISILTPRINVGSISTNQTKSQVGPFKVRVASNTPDNTMVDFRVNYQDGTYIDFETFNVSVALDYFNYKINEIASTVTSNGRVGYSNSDAENGWGFKYKNNPLLFEASLMIGNSSTRVSNNTRLGSGGSQDHFVKKLRVKTGNLPSGVIGRSEFDDSKSSVPFNVLIKHAHYGFQSSPDNKYIIAEYRVINKGTTPLTDMYLGLFTDWDIDEGSNNVTEYDPTSRLAFNYAKASNTLYTGVKLLSQTAAPTYYPLSYYVPGDPLENGSFTIAEKYETLSSGVKSSGLGANSESGYDVMNVTGMGPFTIKPNDSVKVAFALIAGDDLNDLKNSAAAAQAKYDVLAPEAPRELASKIQVGCYPNPVSPGSNYTTLDISLPEDGPVSINLYDTRGLKVRNVLVNKVFNKTFVDDTLKIPINISDLQNGVYICKINFKGAEKSVKINVLR